MPRTPTLHRKHERGTTISQTSDSSSDTNTSEDSQGWTPPLQPPSEIPLHPSTPPSLLTTSPMSVSPIASSFTNHHRGSPSISGSPLLSVPSGLPNIQLEDSWPRVVGTTPIAHSDLLDKGKGRESESSPVKDVEAEWWHLLHKMAGLNISIGKFNGPQHELSTARQIAAHFHPKDGKITCLNHLYDKPLVAMYNQYADKLVEETRVTAASFYTRGLWDMNVTKVAAVIK
ncbi:hypothetical protein SCLCIDRAFT_29752 [Scleroderma citrinum Foug A]|uniref:Uncharacterized protein n=1 Tax=Scleroderma citrinum Foug A TaxID=1036808 RepID=A0A0C3D621_9AGAM|nr:hypothetical protein SCLCIDRAFT_29752 [Scleroderma citrinum Foug A]